MIAIVDYGMGNLRSVQKAFERVGHSAVVTAQPEDVRRAEKIVLPGVGAFGDAVANLTQAGLVEPILDAIQEDRPFLGICVGLQLLFTESEEMGRHPGLDVLPGRVRRFPQGERVPQIGWNQIHVHSETPLLEGIPDGSFFYFVHSYYVDPEDESDSLATTDYGIDYTSIAGRGRVLGIQFHPEKSQDLGLRILKNFAERIN
ncbi:MAG: imidazole glycerol phosphate synthase subunit HisH [Candidatus Latescibacteria bacterium]|jgi:glutamine amidotransferase|nr:imidazole glycerol phosphate synthase subunit HisH [Candidatus Latescibacterota bacterium]